jgi:carbonic anhydrase/acetyltransferase-like protein (isoleucine patch superfamily)
MSLWEALMPVYALGQDEPRIDETAWVHPDAVLVGRVELGPEVSVWPGAVLRGDGGRIVVGARTSIQDGVVVHVGRDLDTVVGAGCVVGHLAHLEGCTVGDGALVGSGAVLLQRVEVGAGALVAAGAVLPPGTVVPPLATARGVPAKVVRDSVEPGAFADSAAGYVERARRYARDMRRV